MTGAPSLPSLLVSHWEVSWSAAAPVAAVGAVYLGAARRSPGRRRLRRALSFLAGLGCVVVALQSGVAAYDDRLLSVHMVQHMLLLLPAPLLLLGGRPVQVALAAAPPRARRRLARWLHRVRPYTAPRSSLAWFAAVVVFTHLPAFYDAALRHPALHSLEHALYLAAGLLMWSPIVDGDPAPRHRLGGLGRLGYLIVAMLPMALVGAFLNRHAMLFYPAYGAPARALGVSALSDQAQAGAFMWVVGNSIMVAVGLWSALAAMVAEERRQTARDARAPAAASRAPAATPDPGPAPIERAPS